MGSCLSAFPNDLGDSAVVVRHQNFRPLYGGQQLQLLGQHVSPAGRGRCLSSCPCGQRLRALSGSICHDHRSSAVGTHFPLGFEILSAGSADIAQGIHAVGAAFEIVSGQWHCTSGTESCPRPQALNDPKQFFRIRRILRALWRVRLPVGCACPDAQPLCATRLARFLAGPVPSVRWSCGAFRRCPCVPNSPTFRRPGSLVLDRKRVRIVDPELLKRSAGGV